MESRRILRQRKRARARLQGIVNVLLVVMLVFIFLILKEEVFSADKPDINTGGSAANPVKAEKTDAVVNEKDVLILVNKDKKLPDGFKADLIDIDNARVDKVLLDDLKAMRSAAERAGIYLFIGSAYRSAAEQEKAFNEAVASFVKQGNSQNVAYDRAKEVAAMPGYSEHETGLAIDFSHDGSAEKRAEMWEWLKNNAWKYGFVLRYPEGKWFMTGYSFEPWHYRYVGQEAAKKIYEQGIVLEDYLGVASDVSAQQTLMISSAPGSLPLDNIDSEMMQSEEG